MYNKSTGNNHSINYYTYDYTSHNSYHYGIINWEIQKENKQEKDKEWLNSTYICNTLELIVSVV